MRLVKYGVTLRRITRGDLELLRNWRNADHVKRFMEFRGYITPEMQQKWFESVNNPENFYYIIEYQDEKVGLINEKNYSRGENKTTESGIFIANEKFSNTHIPVCASLILIEMSFYWLNGKESYIRILKDNISSIRYNKMLGYELCSGQENTGNQLYVLTKEKFEEKTRKIRKAALKISGGDPNLYVIWEKVDFESGIAQAAEEMRKSFPLNINKTTDREGNTVFYYNMEIGNPDFHGKIDPELKITPVDY